MLHSKQSELKLMHSCKIGLFKCHLCDLSYLVSWTFASLLVTVLLLHYQTSEHTWLRKQANGGFRYAQSWFAFCWEEGRQSQHLHLLSVFWYLCNGLRGEKMHGVMLLTFYPWLQIYSSLSCWSMNTSHWQIKLACLLMLRLLVCFTCAT